MQPFAEMLDAAFGGSRYAKTMQSLQAEDLQFGFAAMG